MTWEELANIIMNMSPDQCKLDVTIHLLNSDEFYPVEVLHIAECDVDDIVDKGTPYLIVED